MINKTCCSYDGNPIGQNMYMHWGPSDITMVDVASFWFFEKNDYNYVGNTCVANRLCDDYKQVTFRLRGGFIVATLSNLTTQQNVN